MRLQYTPHGEPGRDTAVRRRLAAERSAENLDGARRSKCVEKRRVTLDIPKEVQSMNQSSRSVAQVVTPEPVVEGAGVHLRRSIGTRKLDHLDPFLLLDHFESIDPGDYKPA